MNWRDLLYFSKGERRALALLLCLITISWILLLWTDTKRMPIEAQTDAHRTENRQAPGERRIITGKNTSEGGKISSGKNPDLIRIKPRIPLKIKVLPLKIKVLPLQVTTPTLQARRGKDIPYTLERKSTRREPSSNSTPPTPRS